MNYILWKRTEEGYRSISRGSLHSVIFMLGKYCAKHSPYDAMTFDFAMKYGDFVIYPEEINPDEYEAKGKDLTVV